MASSRLPRYLSNETNVNSAEVYIRPFDASEPDAPPPGKPVQVSKTGALGMINWRANGKELYYLTRDWQVMAVEISTEPVLQLGSSKTLFKLPGPIDGQSPANGRTPVVMASGSSSRCGPTEVRNQIMWHVGVVH